MNRELKISRIINAPVDLVWKVFSEPGHIALWWGPTGFSNTIHKMEFKKGGVWEFIMHGPDGRDYKNRNVFTEIVKPELIIYDHVSEPVHTTTITLKPEGVKTLLDWNMLFESEDQLACRPKVAG